MRRVALALLLVSVPAVRAQTTATCVGGSAVDTLDANNVRATLYPNGGLFWRGMGNVFNVPKAPPGRPITPNAFFSHSIWFGGYEGTELRQASATYSNWEFFPGPVDAQGQGPADCRPYDRIAALRLRDLQALRQGTVTEAVRDWPWAWGAPVIDGDGVPGNYNLAGGDRPELLGTESHWWVMNAMGPHHRTGSKPFPLEVQVTAFAAPTVPPFATPIPAVDNSILLRYRLIYRGAAPMTGVYFGHGSDPDLGNATDDYIGSDTLLRMGFAYNEDNFDDGSDGYGAAPPAVGILALDGPLLHDDDHDGRADTHGFTSLVYYNSGSCNNCDPRGNTDDYYRFMQARWRDGRAIYACGDGHASQYASCGTTRWMFPGDPVTRAFWSEFRPVVTSPSPNAPSDRRFAMGMGPFTLLPGVPQDVVVAFVWSRGTDHLDSVSKLRRDAAALQAVWNAGGYTAAAQQEPPPAPPVRPALAISEVTPNPVRDAGTVRVRLPASAHVRVWVVDAAGRVVRRLHTGPLPAGVTDVPVGGSGLVPGMYALRVGIGGEVVARPFVVVR